MELSDLRQINLMFLKIMGVSKRMEKFVKSKSSISTNIEHELFESPNDSEIKNLAAKYESGYSSD